ncbi:insulinase family protein [bacterium]|nr:insulinase family protein [bacterium]
MQISQEKNYSYQQLNIHEVDFSNGLKCLFLPDDSVPVFAYHSWFSVGSKDEKEGITGIAHLFEHLMFKETSNYKEGEFDKILEQEGGSINAGTYLDWTYYRQCLPKEAFDISVKLEADRMENVVLNEHQLNSEREVVVNERRFRVDNSPSGTMYEELYKLCFTQHPYHWPIIGWMKDIKSISLQDCMNFYKQYYAPNNACLVFVGDLDKDTIVKKIIQYYGHMQASEIKRNPNIIEPKQTEERYKELSLTIASEKLIWAFKAPSMRHEDYIPLTVLMAILFDGKSSRFDKLLVSEKSLCNDCSGWVDQTMDPGLIHFAFTLQGEKSHKDIEPYIQKQIDTVQNTLVSEQELEKIKNIVEASFWGNFSTADDKAQALGFYQTVFGDFRELFKEMEKLNNVTAQDVMRVAKTYLNKNQKNVLLAKPKTGK